MRGTFHGPAGRAFERAEVTKTVNLARIVRSLMGREQQGIINGDRKRFRSPRHHGPKS